MIGKLNVKKRPQWYAFTYISVLLAMTYILLPTIRAHLPSIVNQAIMLLFTGLSFLGIILQNDWHKPANLTALISVIAFIIIIYLGKWQLIDSFTGNSMLSRMFTLYEFWIFWIISKNAIKFSDDDKRRLLKYNLLLITVTSVTTIIGCLTYPMASRLLAGAASSNEYKLFRGLNIGGYEFIYGVTMLIPLLFYAVYKAKEKKLFLFAAILIVCIAVIISQYATALVLVIITISLTNILYFVRSKKGQIFLIITITILMLLLFSGILMQLLYWLEDILLDYKLETVASRIGEIIHFIKENNWNGTAEAREYLRMQSFSVFLKNPLYGCLFKPEALGGHSEILDILGAGGIIGISLFAIPVISHYKLIKLVNKDRLFKIIFFFEFVIFIVLAYANTLFTSPDIALAFFFIPTLLIRENNDGKII